MLSVVGTSSGCHNVTLGAFSSTQPNAYINMTPSLDSIETTTNKPNGKDTIVKRLNFYPND